MTLSAFGPYWYTPNAYAEGIFSLTRNQVGSRVFTPMVVHAVHRSLLGYFSRANSASFCTALVLSAIGSLHACHLLQLLQARRERRPLLAEVCMAMEVSVPMCFGGRTRQILVLQPVPNATGSGDLERCL